LEFSHVFIIGVNYGLIPLRTKGLDSTVWNDFSFSNQYSAMVTAAGRDFGMSMYPTTEGATQQPIYLKPSQFFSVAETSQYDEVLKIGIEPIVLCLFVK
ncbi:hypothetical protein NE473_31565, partial [Hungatella sp. SL.1.14]|nr:hypothetical protein [Hungatella sp. SL.1.14]